MGSELQRVAPTGPQIEQAVVDRHIATIGREYVQCIGREPPEYGSVAGTPPSRCSTTDLVEIFGVATSPAGEDIRASYNIAPRAADRRRRRPLPLRERPDPTAAAGAARESRLSPFDTAAPTDDSPRRPSSQIGTRAFSAVVDKN